MKQFFTAILCLCAVLTSCKKDDQEDPPASIIGTWTYVSAEYKETDGNGTVTSDNTTFDPGSTYELRSDGTYAYNLEGDTDSGTWKLENNGQTLVSDPGTSHEEKIVIRSLTSHQLILYYKTEDDNYVMETTIHFKR